ncbi:hypothetical protein LXL04_014374 [Taraxacum kok-saghyz]
MGRNLSPVVKQELENLDKDPGSRKSAMKALQSYVKDLDSKAIPIFLAQVSETNETGSTSGEYTISLYEALARVHGTKIVPQIDNIMSTIIKTLKSSVTSFALHQACSKVVPAIARYGIDPTTPDDKKRRIIHSLCKPLSDSLLANQESLSSGSALCLTALVDSDNWRFASTEMVNEVCQRVTGALQKPMQTHNSHMGLVMALAKHNGLVVEAYARLLIWSGIMILNTGASEGNSQKRLVAIQMINYLMKCLDYKCIMSELNFVIEEMEKCEGDQMAFVKGAAFEAIETAKRILTEKGSKFRERSGTPSPESQTMSSFGGYSSMVDSPISVVDSGRSVTRKLWRYDNVGVDVSLKDGFSLGEISTPSSVNENGSCVDEGDGFSGFTHKSFTNGGSRSVSPSPQRARSYRDIDNDKMNSTPRKFDLKSSSEYDENVVVSDVSDGLTNEDEHEELNSESMASTQDILQEVEIVSESKARAWLSAFINVSFLIVVFAVFVCLLLAGDPHDDFNLVPT